MVQECPVPAVARIYSFNLLRCAVTPPYGLENVIPWLWFFWRHKTVCSGSISPVRYPKEIVNIPQDISSDLAVCCLCDCNVIPDKKFLSVIFGRRFGDRENARGEEARVMPAVPAPRFLINVRLSDFISGYLILHYWRKCFPCFPVRIILNLTNIIKEHHFALFRSISWPLWQSSPFGSPVFMNCTSDPAIFCERPWAGLRHRYVIA